MRDIKFRAWNKEKNIMCYENEDNSAGYLDGWVASDIQVINQTLNSDYVKEIYDFMEFTGLKDKNGKEIYEGDIVNQFNTNTIGMVKFKNGLFGIKSKGMFWHIHSKNTEVIGNIYDNPELLEE